MDTEMMEELAADLLKLLRSGSDARTQIDFISNSLRIKKQAATKLQEIFNSGINAGCNSVIDNNLDLPAQNVTSHPLFLASFRLGREDFLSKLEEQRLKHRSGKSKILVYGLIIILTLALIIGMITVK